MLNWDNAKDIIYKQSVQTKTTTITVSHKLTSPRLMTEQGQINAEIKQVNGKYIFKFKLEDIPPLDRTQTYIYIYDQNDLYRLITGNSKRKHNFNNIKAVWYTDNYVYYFRNTASRFGRLTFQKKLRLDHENIKYEKMVKRAQHLYRFVSGRKILIFEKEVNRFEESGARLFERLNDNPHVYFVLNRTSPMYPELKAKYGKKIVCPDEFRFLKYLYTAKYYIGTELPMHLIGVRSPYKYLRREIMKNDKHKFIFLQHGVSMALSLAGPKRDIFRKNNVYSPYKVIVSSDLEAQHLITDGKYLPEDLWKTGLATFDGKRLNPEAKMISVMLTWRPWDELVEDITTTSYYQAIQEIIDNISDKSNLQLILHPKVTSELKPDDKLAKYLVKTDINTALSNTRVMITDYSSAVFDVYYRGANVIFWWKDLEFCLTKYNNYLLLNDDNAFGDICYDSAHLDQLIDRNMHATQHSEYLAKYRQIVEFSDNRNTDRIIEHLQQAQIIK